MQEELHQRLESARQEAAAREAQAVLDAKRTIALMAEQEIARLRGEAQRASERAEKAEGILQASASKASGARRDDAEGAPEGEVRWNGALQRPSPARRMSRSLSSLGCSPFGRNQNTRLSKFLCFPRVPAVSAARVRAPPGHSPPLGKEDEARRCAELRECCSKRASLMLSTLPERRGTRKGLTCECDALIPPEGEVECQV